MSTVGFGLVIRFIEHLWNVTTNNYGNLTELHTTAHMKSSQSSLAVAWWRLPMADVPLPLGSELSPASATSFSILTAVILNRFNHKSKLLYDWRFAANQFVLAPNSLSLAAPVFFSTESLQS
jgi:hypothetical protein